METRKCLTCSKSFDVTQDTRRFCSSVCRYQYHNEHKDKAGQMDKLRAERREKARFWAESVKQKTT
jgi:hypothetical protein